MNFKKVKHNLSYRSQNNHNLAYPQYSLASQPAQNDDHRHLVYLRGNCLYPAIKWTKDWHMKQGMSQARFVSYITTCKMVIITWMALQNGRK